MSFKLLCASILSLCLMGNAIGGEAEDKVFSLTSAVKSRYMSDGGDIKLFALDLEDKVRSAWGDSTKCSKRRAGDLSRAYRGVLDAASKQDAKAIYEAAKNLNFHAYQRSTMFTRCWNHMAGQSKMVGEVFDVAMGVIAVGAGAGW